MAEHFEHDNEPSVSEKAGSLLVCYATSSFSSNVVLHKVNIVELLKRRSLIMVDKF